MMSKNSDKKEQSWIWSFWPFGHKEKRIYDDDHPFKPFSDCRREEKQDIIDVHLQGYKKKDLQVETDWQNLVIQGERLLSSQKWQKFRKEFKLRDDWVVTDDISAQLLSGVLRITIPKKKWHSAANLRKSFSRWCSKMWKSFSKREASCCGVLELVLLLLCAFQAYVILKNCSALKY